MPAQAGPNLKGRLELGRAHETFDVNIFLSDEPARQLLSEAAAMDAPMDVKKVIGQIKSRCAGNQRLLLAYLEKKSGEAGFADDVVSVASARPLKSYWINNSVAAELTLDAVSDVLKRDDVLYVELTHHADVEELMDATAEPAASDTAARIAWGVRQVNAPLLWRHGLNGEGVLAAVIDTGVNYRHPDLSDHMWDGGSDYPRHGYDFESDDTDPVDEQGHGTACAGIVAGDGAEGLGTGVAPGATVMALRVGGAERNFWDAFEFAIDRDVDVISMSMSWKYPSNPDYPGWRRASETLLAAGILHANSIGNQGDRLQTYPIPYNIATPGNCPPPYLNRAQQLQGGVSSAIGCGATDSSDVLAGYSGRGPAAWENAPFTDYPHDGGKQMGLLKPDVCAPGPGTTSCNWQYRGTGPGTKPYRGFGGTSAATPHVGGCLCLLAQACKNSNPRRAIIPRRVHQAIEETAVRILGQTEDKQNDYGAGRVDVYMAYQYGRKQGWWS